MERFFLPFITIGLAAFSMGACKIRDGASAEKKNPSDLQSDISQEVLPSVDLSKSPVFVRCSSIEDQTTKVDLSLHHNQQTGAALINYQIAETPQQSQSGRWDNYDEANAYQYIYSFGDLRLIFTNEPIFSNAYPATLLGTDASGKYQEHTLSCDKL
jgi:hypothetical protein